MERKSFRHRLRGILNADLSLKVRATTAFCNCFFASVSWGVCGEGGGKCRNQLIASNVKCKIIVVPLRKFQVVHPGAQIDSRCHPSSAFLFVCLSVRLAESSSQQRPYF